VSSWTGTIVDPLAALTIKAADTKQVSDAVSAITDPWTSYSPAWTTGGTAPAIGNGTLTGSFSQSGKFVAVRIILQPGSTTTFGTTAWRFSLPVTPIANQVLGALVNDTSASQSWAGQCWIFAALATGDNTRIIVTDASGGITGTAPMTWASGDKLIINGIYEAA